MNAAPPADPERLRRVNALLETAPALPVDERETWLQTLPPQDRPGDAYYLNRRYDGAEAHLRGALAQPSTHGRPESTGVQNVRIRLARLSFGTGVPCARQ